MAQPGVVAAVTISVLLTKYFLTVPCLRRRAPHHCGDPEPSRTIGLPSVVFSTPALSVSGKFVSMVLSQDLDKLLVYVPATKAAIMRRGFICTSLIGTISGIIKLATTGTFASKNGQRALEIELGELLSDHSHSS